MRTVIIDASLEGWALSEVLINARTTQQVRALGLIHEVGSLDFAILLPPLKTESDIKFRMCSESLKGPEKCLHAVCC